MVVTSFEVLPRNLPGMTEENHKELKELQAGQLTFWPRFELGFS
jgi:hypothetical protein